MGSPTLATRNRVPRVFSELLHHCFGERQTQLAILLQMVDPALRLLESLSIALIRQIKLNLKRRLIICE